MFVLSHQATQTWLLQVSGCHLPLKGAFMNTGFDSCRACDSVLKMPSSTLSSVMKCIRWSSSHKSNNRRHAITKRYNKTHSFPIFYFRCEVRPGPEYILRHYQFHNKSHFDVRQYYYDDADCMTPQYALTARGTYNVRTESWTVPGATELDYHLMHVAIIPYTQRTADELRRTINASCPMHGAMPWLPNRRYDLYHFMDLENLGDHIGETNEAHLGESAGIIHEEDYIFQEKDCTEDLYFSLHELQLMRLEQRHHHHGDRTTLYLGDIHTDRHQRPIYRPTGYQEDPLLQPQVILSYLPSNPFYNISVIILNILGENCTDL